MRRLKAPYLLVENLRALIASRRVNAKDLAQWCGHKPPWISKILAGERGVAVDDLDKIADFFGLEVWHLFAPGISLLLERRRAERRSGEDRRSGNDRRQQPDRMTSADDAPVDFPVGTSVRRQRPN